MKYMPAVIFAVILGTIVGLVIHLGKWFNKGALLMQRPITKMIPTENLGISKDEFMSLMVTATVLFCASGTGIYGALDEGMSGDITILVSKSILDFFTAAIFAASLGYAVSIIAIPQFIIFVILFFLARFILPYTNSTMILDFKACGGFLMLATGFRIVKLKMFPIAEMIPAMILVMPLSWLWGNVILNFIH
ncbi:putative membrane protein YdfK [Lactobacillus helveticus]|nr:putative membrane protein YdfK [Lactobacillus helveticus]